MNTKFYFTFGLGSKLAKYYVCIIASSEDVAREIMFENFGSGWAFCYGQDRWICNGISQAEKYGLHNLAMLQEGK